MSEAVQVTPPQPVAQAQKPHRSPSAMGTYFGCGEDFRRRYMEHERIPPTLSMLGGTGMHKGAEHNFRQKIDSHVDLPVADVVAAAVAGFDAAIAKDGLTLFPEELALGEGVAVGMKRDEVANSAAAFRLTQSPDYQPKAVEQLVRIPVPKGTHDLLGIMDLVADDIARGVDDVVVDFKNAKKSKSAADAAESTQLTFYSAAHQVQYGKPPSEVRLDVLVTTKKGVSRQLLVEHRDAKDFQVLANRLNAMEQGVKAGVFLPAAPGSWKCSAKWCPWFTRGCVYVNAERIEAAKAAEE